VKRTALLVLLLAAYAGVFGRHMVTGTGEGFDPLAPQAREIERSLAYGRFQQALPLAKELQALHPEEPLIDLWLARIYHGMRLFADEAKAWERFIEIGGAPEEACPWLAYAYARSKPDQQDLAAQERCVALDPRDPERLVDLGLAFEQAGKRSEALAAYKRAAELESRHRFVAQRIERLSQALAGGQR
jgi:tetratricopeptide (TPR) repeat protein